MHCTSLVEDLPSALEKDISVDCYWRENSTAQKDRPCQQVSHVQPALGFATSHMYLFMYLLFLVIMSKGKLASTEHLQKTKNSWKKQLCIIFLIVALMGSYFD